MMSMTQANSPERQNRRRQIEQQARDLGFALVGVAPALPSDYGDYFKHWLDSGKHGEMAYLSRNVEKRLDPRALLPGARSIIYVADRHASELPEEMQILQERVEDTARGKIARYAWGRDYHKTIKARLHHLSDLLQSQHPHDTFKTCVDTAPLMEREHAARAGLGWIGKHTLLINPMLGSWLLLGAIVTTLEIEATAEASLAKAGTATGRDNSASDFFGQGFEGCGNCTRCIDACPTQCIDPAGYKLDASRCISYLTIEHRSEFNSEQSGLLNDWLAGCDVCQEVCPWNQAVPATSRQERLPQSTLGEYEQLHPDYQPRAHARGIDTREVMQWTEEDRQRAFAGTALTRIKLEMAKRNARAIKRH